MGLSQRGSLLLLARVLAYKQEEEKAGGWGGVTLWGGGGRNGIELKGASVYVTSAFVSTRLHTD